MHKVREVVKYGADVIKFCASGGVFSKGDNPLLEQYSPAEMQALVTEAHRLGRKAATHAHSALAIKDAVRAAVDSVEHGIFLDDEGIQLMKEHKTFLVPTSYPLFWFEEHAPQMHFPQWVLEKAAIIIPAAKQNMTRAFRSGVRVALGTDAGVYPHGENGGEFWSMVTLGMAPIQALQAGTITPEPDPVDEESDAALPSVSTAETCVVPAGAAHPTCPCGTIRHPPDGCTGSTQRHGGAVYPRLPTPQDR